MKKVRFLIFPIIFMLVLSGCDGINSQTSVSSMISESEILSSLSEPDAATYTVTWLNADGKVLEVDYDVPEGSYPVYNGETPSFEANGRYTYIFTGWSPERELVFSDQEYTATFTSIVNTYTITWVDYDDKVLHVDRYMEYGEMPVFSGSTPTRKGDAQFSYIFDGWSPEIKTVTKDQKYTATYSKVINKYTVTWVNDDGSQLEVDYDVPYGTMPSYDGILPTRDDCSGLTYTFIGWSPEITPVTGNITYWAVFSENLQTFNVTWIDEDGTIFFVSEDITYGTFPPSYVPDKPATNEFTFTFERWEPEIAIVTGDQTYTAVFTKTIRTYEVTWLDEDGSLLFSENFVPYGTIPVYPYDLPIKQGDAEKNYTFAGWSPNVTAIEGNTTYRATYATDIITYRIEWLSDTGELLYADPHVPYGTMPSYPPVEPTKEKTAQYTYEFSGWNIPLSVVVSNQTYIATFTKSVNTYTVEWLNDDNSVLAVDYEVPYGTTPVYQGPLPTKAETLHSAYYFNKWSPQIKPVEGDQTYKATFSEEIKTYTITWLDDDESVLDISRNVMHGTMPEYPYGNPEKVSAKPGYTYSFAGWSPTIQEATGDATYQASYTLVYVPETLFSYSVHNGEAIITNFKDKEITTLNIPERLGGLPVTMIDYGAFQGFPKLQQVTFPSTLHSIETYAFNYSKLERVTINENINYIGFDAFANCTALKEVVIIGSGKNISFSAFKNCPSLNYLTIPNGYSLSMFSDFSNLTLTLTGEGVVDYSYLSADNGLKKLVFSEGITAIKDRAFANNVNLREVVLPNSLVEIADYAFQNCLQLTSINLPPNLITIGEKAFENCRTINELSFGENILTIGERAFANCSSIVEIVLPSSLERIGDNVFENCSSLRRVTVPNTLLFDFKANFASLNVLAVTVVGSGTISANVFTGLTNIDEIILAGDFTHIEARAFADCANLEKITLPSGIKTIGNEAFAGCNKITEITLPASVETIGDYAFSGCSALLMVNLPTGLELLGNGAFAYCTNLVTITIPSQIETIGSNVFANCLSLTTVILPDNIIGIATNAFVNCYALTTINLPNSLLYIGSNTFAGCQSLQAIVLPQSLLSLGSGAFQNCSALVTIVLSEQMITINPYTFSGCVSLQTISLPANLVIIEEGAFQNCLSLRSIILPETLTEIADFAFKNCTSLLNITFPDQVTKIANGAFYNCYMLTVIRFGRNLAEIGAQAFYGCSLLETITISLQVETIGAQAFWNCSRLKQITIPVTYSGQFLTIFSGHGLHVHLIGNGNVSAHAFDVRNNSNTSLLVVVLNNGILEIGEYAFAGNIYLTTLGMSQLIQRIDDYAFVDCTSLEDIFLPDTLRHIGYGALFGCLSITELVIPQSVNSYGYILVQDSPTTYRGIIQTSENLELLKIPNNVQLLQVLSLTPNRHENLIIKVYGNDKVIENAFLNTNLRAHIILEEGITGIGEYAFKGSSNLLSITLPNSLMTIEQEAFYNCLWLTALSLPSKLTTIGEKAFRLCVNIHTLTIPLSVMTIGNYAFANCTKLTTIELSVTQLNNLGLNCFEGIQFALLITGSGEIKSGNIARAGNVVTVTIGPHINSINKGAFANCQHLTSITVDPLNNDYLTIDGVLYTRDGKTLLVYPAKRNNAHFVIPSMVETIGENAFINNEFLQEITILPTVIFISDGNFFNCKKLTIVELPVHLIGKARSLFTNYGLKLILSGEGEINAEHFANYTALTVLVIGEGISYIAPNAFSGLVNLISVELSQYNPFYREIAGAIYTSDETILVYYLPGNTNYAFFLSATVTTIYAGAFLKAENLGAINVDANNSVFMSFDGVLYNKEGTHILYFPRASIIVNFVILDSLTTIDPAAFQNYEHILSFTASADNNYFTTINGVLYNKDATILLAYPPARVNTTFTIPASVTAIYPNAFGINNYLQTLEVSVIALNNIEIAIGKFKNLTLVITGDEALTNSKVGTFFAGMTGLVIRETVTGIVSSAFITNTTITYLSLPTTLCDDFTNAFPKLSSFTLVITGSGIIPSDVFANLSGIRTLIISEGITEISNSAFQNCINLANISLPETLLAINYGAFLLCTSLTAVTIPTSVTLLAANSFYGCSSLKELTIPLSLLSQLASSIIMVRNLHLFIVGAGEIPARSLNYLTGVSALTLDDRITSLGYNDLSELKELHVGKNFASFGDNTFPSLNVLSMSPENENFRLINGVIYSYDYKTLIFYTFDESMKQYTVLTGTERIAANAFYQRAFLERVVIPASVLIIEEKAFAYCSSLTSVVLPANLKTIETEVFAYCSRLVEIYLPSGLITISERAFQYCASLQVYLPNGLVTIGKEAFYSCGSLTAIILPESLKNLGLHAFMQCKNLQTVTMDVSLAASFHSVFDAQGINLTITGNGKIYEAAFYVEPGKYYSYILGKVTLGVGITEIGENAFMNCLGLTSATILSDQITIKDYAFNNCLNLRSIEFAGNVNLIGNYIFNYCRSLTQFSIPAASLGQINDIYANYNSTLTITGQGTIESDFILKATFSNIIIAEGITAIGTEAFRNCRYITSITLPNSLHTIGDRAFSGCSALVNINLPPHLIYIGEAAFEYCTRISVMVIPTGVTSLNNYTFRESGISAITLPNNLTSIGDGVFANCSNLKTIIIPHTVTMIGKQAFMHCSRLTTIELPANLLVLGAEAFRFCTSLGNIVLPNKITVIEAATFDGCSSLTSLILPSGLLTIGDYAFGSCVSLQSIEIPTSVTRIGESAFSGAVNLQSIIIPSMVTAINDYTFAGCSSLANITLPENLLSIGAYAFFGCSSLVSIALPYNVVTISDYMFASCTSLQSIILHDAITRIGTYSFSACEALTTVHFSNNLESIGKGAFMNCSALKKVSLAPAMNTIGDEAFIGCIQLTTLIITGTNVEIGRDAFNGCTALATTFFPNGLQVIGSRAFYGCPQLKDITLPVQAINDFASVFNGNNLVVTIIGDGELAANAFQESTSIIAVYFNGNITKISKQAFYGCSNLVSVYLNNEIKVIDTQAFANCLALENITFPSALISVGDEAFSNCYSLKKLQFGEHVEMIGKRAFSMCINVQEIVFCEGLKTIDDNAFAYCNALVEISIPRSVQFIGAEAFFGNVNLVKITIHAENPQMYTNAFMLCPQIKTVIINPQNLRWLYDVKLIQKFDLTIIGNGAINHSIIPWSNKYWIINSLTISEGITAINGSAFSYTDFITEIVIPDSVVTIDTNSFAFCRLLKNVTLPFHLAPQYANAFNGNSNITLTLTGRGILPSNSLGYAQGIRHLIIGGDITEIESYAIMNPNIQELTIGDNVKIIQASAFTCFCVLKINIGKNVTHISNGAFMEYFNLLEIVVDPQNNIFKTIDGVLYSSDETILILYPSKSNRSTFIMSEKVITIADHAFERATYLTSITLSPVLETIGAYAFAECSKLTIIRLPRSVNVIGDYAFFGCYCLFAINLSDVLCIGYCAFQYCSKLQAITLSVNLEEISPFAFNGCQSLTHVDIPASVKTIGEKAFYECVSLLTITLYGRIDNISSNAFPAQVNILESYVNLGFESLSKQPFPKRQWFI